jgi:hypothetical protein
VVAAFGGTAYAALRTLDTGPDAQTLRERRTQQQAAHERKRRQARKPAKRGRRKPPAAAVAAPPSRPRARRSWGVRANALCETAENESLVLVERYPARTPTEILRFLDAAVSLTGRLVVRIERLGPAPNRQLHAQLMRELHASVADGRRAVESLRRRWSPGAVNRVVQDAPRDRVISRLFRRLGAPSCAGL